MAGSVLRPYPCTLDPMAPSGGAPRRGESSCGGVLGPQKLVSQLPKMRLLVSPVVHWDSHHLTAFVLKGNLWSYPALDRTHDSTSSASTAKKPGRRAERALCSRVALGERIRDHREAFVPPTFWRRLQLPVVWSPFIMADSKLRGRMPKV